MSEPPFKAGYRARGSGQPIEANPYDPEEAFGPDDYPGRHACWRDGWTLRDHYIKRKEQK